MSSQDRASTRREFLGHSVRFTIAVGITPACLSGVQPAEGAGPLVKFSHGTGLCNMPLFYAGEKKLFAKYGANAEVVLTVPGTATIQLASNQVEMAVLPYTSAIAAYTRSPGFSVISGSGIQGLQVVAKPGIKSFADLKGKLIGLADEAGTITISTRKLLALHGLSTGDFRVKIIEGTPARYQCLVRGECDAVPLGQPQDFSAIEKGCRVLGLSTEVVPELLYTVTAARRSWAEAHKDALVRYTRGLAAAFKFIRDPAKRGAVVKAVVEATDASSAAAEQSLKLFFEPERGVLPKQGEINVKGLTRVIEYMGEAGTLKNPLPGAERFVDLRYLVAAGIQ